MKTYSLKDAEAIFRDYGEQWLELKADGVHLRNEQLQFDPTQALHWKYVCELDGADSPNPLTAPCLPFPFTANQLAAFMLDGVGAVISSVYGNWENGPDQGMLDSMGVLAREPRRAMTEAYTAYMTAQGTVGPYPSSLEKRVGRLSKIHSYRNGKANKHEGVFADDITPAESRTRRERAVASNLELWTQLNSAKNEYEAAFNGWRNAMVRQLLQPAPAQSPATPAVQGNETKEQRQDRRLKACIDAGLPMNDKAALLRLPYGVGDIAESEGVTRQAFSIDVKAALVRQENTKREGLTVHRI